MENLRTKGRTVAKHGPHPVDVHVGGRVRIRPITKLMLPDGVKGDTAPLALGLWYDFHEVGCHLVNVG